LDYCPKNYKVPYPCEVFKLIKKNKKGDWIRDDFTPYTPPKREGLEVKRSDYRKKDPLIRLKPNPKVKKINKSISHLSTSEKMEMYSFDLDPKACGCADRCNYGKEKICYVLNNGHERYPARKLKLKRNLEFIKSDKFDSIKYEILKTRQRQFRWFGAGDVPDYESFVKIIKVCKQLPAVEFWLPTSRDDILTRFFEIEKAQVPRNCKVRLSAPDVCEEMPAFMLELCKKWGITYSLTTLDESKATCHASIDGGSCEMCEDCFKLEPVTYLIHGRNARKRAHHLQRKREVKGLK
jgi:hypothetical protein